jgi:glutathionylspermidine synthase
LQTAAYRRLRRRVVLDGCKWDPQVGDVATLAPFPLLLSQPTWHRLANDAEALASETLRIEEALLHAPSLQRRIAVPRRLRRTLAHAARTGMPPCPVRVMRFDLHPTSDGWRVSEVNSDVPGGFTEAGLFTRLMAQAGSAETGATLLPAGDPAALWADALLARTDGPIAVLAAAGFMEDQQVAAYLASRLRERQRQAAIATPQQLQWEQGHATLHGLHLGAIVRFYQGEWLARLPRRTGWELLLAGGQTPVTNPAAAILGESKRLPLAWDELPFDVPTWRRLLPETRDPRAAPWRSDDGWLVKSAYCNTGDTVCGLGITDAARWRRVARHVHWNPGGWVAQRRFQTLAIDSPIGQVYPCVGVYVIDGRAAGAYARVSRASVVDYAAIDVALLVREGVADGSA